MSTWNRTSLLALFGAGTLALSACGMTGGDEEKKDDAPKEGASQSEEAAASEGGSEQSDDQDDQAESSESDGQDDKDDQDDKESDSSEPDDQDDKDENESDDAESSESDDQDDKDEQDDKDDQDDKDSEGDPKAVFGTEEPNLNEAWEVAKKNLEDAESVKISIKEMDGAEAGLGSGTVNMEIEGKTDDSETAGTMELGEQGTMTYKVVDGTSYVKGMEEQDPQMKELMDAEGAEWVSSSEMNMAEAGVGTMIDEMLKGVEEGNKGKKLAPIDPETTTHDGEEVFEYREPAAKKGDKDSIILVDKEGYLVSIAVEEGDAGTVTFEDWDDVDQVEAPDKDKVLDLDSMTGGSSSAPSSSDESSSSSSEESSSSEG